MYTDFHERYLSKIVAMDILSKFAGFTDRNAPVCLTGEQLENDAKRRRGVILSLTEHKYLEPRALGQTDYTVTQKAFNDCDQEEYVGELNIGTPDKPLATWLSGPMMKGAINDLVANKAVIKDASTGRGKVVVSTFDSRSKEEVAFDLHLSESLGQIACNVTEMSKVFSECLKVPPNSITAKGGEEQLEVLQKENAKEIQRLKRTNDAITVFLCEVDDLDGWEKFIELAKERFSPAP